MLSVPGTSAGLVSQESERKRIKRGVNRGKNMGGKQLTLAEKWQIDAEAYKKGAVNKTSVPQCAKCRYVKKGDALTCLLIRKHEQVQ